MLKLICFISLLSTTLGAPSRKEETSSFEDAFIDAGKKLASASGDNATGMTTRCGGHQPILPVRPSNETDPDPENNNIGIKARCGGHQPILPVRPNDESDPNPGNNNIEIKARCGGHQPILPVRPNNESDPNPGNNNIEIKARCGGHQPILPVRPNNESDPNPGNNNIEIKARCGGHQPILPVRPNNESNLNPGNNNIEIKARCGGHQPILPVRPNNESDLNPGNNNIEIKARCGGHQPILPVRPNNESDLNPGNNNIEIKARCGGHQPILPVRPNIESDPNPGNNNIEIKARCGGHQPILPVRPNNESDPNQGNNNIGIKARCGGHQPILPVRLSNETDPDPEDDESRIKARSGGDRRIVGGKFAPIAIHPYQVSVQENNKHFCGGSIISPQWVLSAAHCRTKATPQYTVRVGSSSKIKGGYIYPVVAVTHHGRYNDIYDYDIAVVRIGGTFTYGPTVQPIPLATRTPPPNAWAVASGWGLTENGYPTHLLEVSVPIVKHDLCKWLYRNLRKGKITPRMLCAGQLSGGHNTCVGDSGGPLVYKGAQVGVVSWATKGGCALPNTPTVFSNVAVLRSWIKEKTGV